LREEQEGEIDVKPPTEMVEYRYTVNTGAGGSAEFIFRDGGHAYVSDGTAVALSVVKSKEGEGSKAMVNLESGAVNFDLGTGNFQLETGVVQLSARSSVFSAEVTETFDLFRNERGEMIMVTSKKEGPSKGMVAEVRPGSELMVRHGPEVEGVVFSVPEEAKGETVFRIKGKVLRMPGGSKLEFSTGGNSVRVSVPTDEGLFAATVLLREFLSPPVDAAFHDAGDLIETGNVSP
jgi:hypothetical protein